MIILEIGRYKGGYNIHGISPFVLEQGEALRTLGIDVRYWAIKGKGLLTYVTSVHKLRHVINEVHPDVVHAHYGLSGITAILAVKGLLCKGRVSKTRVVVTFHNGETLNKVVNLLSSFISLFADHVIYVAQHIHDLVYFKSKHYTIIPCGVNIAELPIMDYTEARRQLGFVDNKKYILFGGAFNNLRKNVALLQDALNLLHRNDIEVIEMKELSRAECALRMCACDLFALPTHSEGSPQALKEAMACNCPIVATDCADIAHLLGDLPGHYILRNPRKTKERWDGDAMSVQEMAALVEQGLAFGQRTEGRKRIAELQLENSQVAQRLMDIYNNI